MAMRKVRGHQFEKLGCKSPDAIQKAEHAKRLKESILKCLGKNTVDISEMEQRIVAGTRMQGVMVKMQRS